MCLFCQGYTAQGVLPFIPNEPRHRTVSPYLSRPLRKPTQCSAPQLSSAPHMSQSTATNPAPGRPKHPPTLQEARIPVMFPLPSSQGLRVIPVSRENPTQPTPSHNACCHPHVLGWANKWCSNFHSEPLTAALRRRVLTPVSHTLWKELY